MSKPIKNMITAELQRRFDGVDSVCVVDVSRLDAISTNRMRGELGKQNIRMHVVKNSMARRALEGGPLEPLAVSLDGPCALVFGDPALTDIAKLLDKWAKDFEQIELKQGIMEGDPDLVSVAQLAQMKGRLELVADIGMLISSPGRALASALQSAGGKIAGCLKEMIEKQESN